MYIKIAFSVVAVFVVCEAAAAVNTRLGCNELLACLELVDDYLSANASTLSVLHEDENYGRLCQYKTNFQSCVAVQTNKCNKSSDIRKITGSEDVLTYLCTAQGKQDLVNFAKSWCVQNQEAISAALVDTSDCLDIFYSNMSKARATVRALNTTEAHWSLNFCPYYNQLSSCSRSALSRHCDVGYVTLMHKAWALANGPLVAHMKCDLNV